MSTSETSSVTPQQQLPTESGNGETDISTNVESRSKELRIQGPSTAPSAISSQTLPERSGILAESQRLQREMLRAEMSIFRCYLVTKLLHLLFNVKNTDAGLGTNGF
uniref:Uncharacterized protein n=1 Tax=Mesocestoides corti TaxID=53468 RepID=A0A5K3EZ00_MESCO